MYGFGYMWYFVTQNHNNLPRKLDQYISLKVVSLKDTYCVWFWLHLDKVITLSIVFEVL